MPPEAPPSQPTRWNAPCYDQWRIGHSPTAISHIKRRAGLTPSTVMLDLACGTGIVLRDFLSQVGMVYGVDISDEMLTEARRRYPETPGRLQFVQARGEALPFPDGTFDLVTIGQAIHHFDLPKVIAEIRRTLKPGGWLGVLSKYPSPREPADWIAERVLDKYTTKDSTAPCKLTRALGAGNILGLERAGFTDYERVVFEYEIERPVEDYVDWSTHGASVQLGEEDRLAYRAELECELRRAAPSGSLRERHLEFVFTARRAPNM